MKLSTITIISLIVLVGIYIILSPLFSNSLSSNSIFSSPSNQMLNKTNCNDPKLLNILPTLTQEKQQTAITLAENSKIFQKNTIGLNYVVANVAPNYSFDPKTCSNITINAVTVGFKLSNGSSLGICEDGSISKVTGANIPRVIHGHPPAPSLP
ncbi:MAG: hypothetical protein ACREBJ_10970 [Nitrosotalea sp.]